MREPCACGGLDCVRCHPEGYYPPEMCDDCPYANVCAEDGPSEVCLRVEAAREEAAQDEYDRRKDERYWRAVEESGGWWT